MAGPGTKAFDPAAHILTLAGAELKGFGPTDKVAGTFPEMYTMVVGVDGEVARGKTNNKTSLWAVRLMQTSLANDILMNIFLADDLAPAGTVVPFFLKNLNGTLLITAATAWATKVPDFTIASEPGVVEWTIQCGETIAYVGGQAALG